MTVMALQKRCNYWLDTLQMGEWQGRVNIHLKSAKALEEITGSPSTGGCLWSTEECRADIYLLKHAATEDTLLHELVHLLLEGHSTYKGYDELLERANNRIVNALMKGVSY